MGTICEPRTLKSSPKYCRLPMGMSPKTNWPIGYDSTALNGDDDKALATRPLPLKLGGGLIGLRLALPSPPTCTPDERSEHGGAEHRHAHPDEASLLDDGKPRDRKSVV